MKILHITSVETDNYYLNNLVDFSDKSKVTYGFVTFGAEGSFTKEIRKRGAAAYALKAQSALGKPAGLLRLKKIIKEFNPDIIHTHLFVPSYLGLTLAKWNKRKTVLTRHHSDALYVLPSKLKQFLWLKLEKIINRKSDHIIAPSKMVYEILADKEHVPTKKLSLIPYGQRPERFDIITPAIIEATRRELGMNDTLALTYVARLFKRKGHEYLFESFAAILKKDIKATLYLVGAGPHQAVLEQLASDLGITNNIKFLGWREDALAIMGASDIIVHPSLEDALSSAVIESIMLEKPIIATDISGVRDTLDEGKYGIIVPPANAKAFENAIYEMINNLAAAKEKAKQGRKYLLHYMDARRVSDAYAEVYEKVISGS